MRIQNGPGRRGLLVDPTAWMRPNKFGLGTGTQFRCRTSSCPTRRAPRRRRRRRWSPSCGGRSCWSSSRRAGCGGACSSRPSSWSPSADRASSSASEVSFVECGARNVRAPRYPSRVFELSNEPSRRSLRAPTAGREHAATEYDSGATGCDGSTARCGRAVTIGPFPTEVPWRSGCLAAAACVD